MLIYREAMRLRAEGGLLQMQAVLAGIAPTQAKSGARLFDKVRDALLLDAGK